MSSVDNRVVRMTFDNAQFEREISRSQTSLGNLERGLSNLVGRGADFGQNFFGRIKNVVSDFSKHAAMHLEGIKVAEASFSTSNMVSALDTLENRFSAMGIVGMSVLDNLGDKLFDMGSKALKALPNAIFGGGYKRAQAIENARFTLQGLVDDEKEVEAIMGNAKDSVDGTAYAYNDAATAAANFAATGMGSGDKMLHTLQGIAGTAATVNADYSDIAHIFTTIAGNGRVMGEQLNQFSYRGLNAAATVAKSFNEVVDGTSTMNEEAQNRIRSLISENSGDIKNIAKITEEDIRKLASKGVLDFETFGEIMYDRFGEHAKKANDTFTGSMANVRAALARTGEMFFAGLIVQKGPLVRLFNAVRESINAFNNQLKEAFGWEEHQGAIAWTNFVTMLADGATTVVKAFTESGGIEGIGNIFKAIGSVLKPIGAAFDAIFGYTKEDGTMVSGIQHIAEAMTKLNAPFKEFTESLILNEDAQKKLQAVMEIVFDILKVGAVIVKNIIMIAGSVLNVIWKIIGAIADFIGTIFYIFNEGRRTVDILEIISTAIDFLGVVIRSVIRGIGKIIDWISGKLNKLYSIFMGAADSASGFLGPLIPKFQAFGQAVRDSIDQDSLRPFADYILNMFPRVKKAFEDLHGSLWNFKEVLRIKWQTKGILIYRAKIYQLKKALGELGEKLSYFMRNLDEVPGAIKSKFENLGPVLESVKESLASMGNTIGEKFGNLKLGFLEKFDAFISKIKNAGSKIKEFFSNLDFRKLYLGLVSGGFTAYIIYMLKMFRDIVKSIKSFAKIATIPAKVAGILTELKDTLKAYQKEIYANAILKIAVAIGILAAALWVLSKVPTEKLLPAIGVIGALFGELVGAMKLLSIMSATSSSLSISKKGFAFQPSSITQMALAMVPMAAAIVMLGRVVQKLGSMSWEEMTRGLIGMTACLAELMAAMYFITRLVNGSNQGKKGMLTTADSVKRFTTTVSTMLPMAVAVWIMAQALAKLGQLDLDQVVQGGVAIVVVMAAMAGFMKFVDQKTVDIKSAASMVIIAGALYLLAGAIMIYAYIPWEMFGAGLLKIASSIAAIGGVMYAFPKEKTIQTALAFTIISAALYVLAGAIILFALLPIEMFVTGLAKVCIALFAVLAIATQFGKGKKMAKVASALLILGTAMIFLGAAFLVFSAVSIGGLITGLIALAGTLFILGVAATVFEGVVPMMLALCGALALLGLSIALVGGGFALLAWGFTTLGAAGTVGATEAVAALGILLNGLATLLPEIAGVIVMGMLLVAQQLAATAPEFAKAFTDFVYAFIEATAELRVKLQELAYDMMAGMADVIIRKAPELGAKLTKAAVAIIGGLIPGVKAFGDAITKLIIAIMTSIKDHIVDVATAGAELAVALVEGIATGIESNTDAMYNAMVHLKEAIVGWFKALLGIHSPSTVMAAEGENIPTGISEGIQNVIDSGQLEEVMGKLGDTLSDGFTSWIEGGGVGNMINSLSTSLFKGLAGMIPGMRQAGEDFAKNYNMSGGQYNYNILGPRITGQDYINANKDTVAQVQEYSKQVGEKLAEAQQKAHISTLIGYTGKILDANKQVMIETQKGNAKDAAKTGLSLAGKLTGAMASGGKSGTNVAKITASIKGAIGSARNASYNSAANTMVGVGSQLISGIIQGTNNKSGFLFASIKAVIYATVAAARAAAAINSPSRLFRDEVGIGIPEGIAVGVYKKAGLVEDAAKDVIKNSVRSVSLLTDKISGTVEDSLDSEPVITPVVDLTDVLGKSNDIANMLGGAYAYAMSSNIISNRRRAQDAAIAAASSSNNVVNQYNNMHIVQQPGESMGAFVDRVVGKLETAVNMEG